MLKLLSLDVWNTLLRLDVIYKAIANVLSDKGLGNSEQIYRTIKKVHAEAKALKVEGKLSNDKRIIDESLKLLSTELGISDRVIRESIVNASNELNLKKLTYDGVIDGLQAAKELGLKVVLLGNVLFWSSKLTKDLLRKAGILSFVDATYFADETGIQKPDSRAFRRFLTDFSLKPSEAMHVGDSITEDFGGALASGLSATLITEDINEVIYMVGSRIFFIPSIKYLGFLLRELMKQ